MGTTEIANRKYVSPPSTGSEKFVSKTPQDCKYFHTCSANLCPLDSEVSKRIWLLEESDNEEICRNTDFAGLQFVITQKKIRRALRNRTDEREDYFPYEMLNRNFIVRPGIRGSLRIRLKMSKTLWRGTPRRRRHGSESILRENSPGMISRN
jgi:hypothetical protein